MTMTLSREKHSPSHIDAMLSLSFDECSIAAADTSALAENLAFGPERAHVKQQQSLYLADRLGATIEPRIFETLPIATVEPNFDLANHKPVDIIIANNSNEHSKTPFMAAVMSSGIAIEIARFEKRLNGECSYVQLGQEITDDALVVTPSDPRSQQVESIRALFNAYITGDTSAFDQATKDTFNRFVASELQSNRARIEELLAPALSMLARRLAHDELSQSRQPLYKSHPEGILTVQASPHIRPLANDMIDNNKLVSFNPIAYQSGNDDRFRAVNFHLTTDSLEPENSGLLRRFRRSNPAKHTSAEVIALSATVRDELAIDLIEFHNDSVLIVDSLNEGNRTHASSEQLLALATLLDANPTNYTKHIESLQSGISPAKLAASQSQSNTQSFWRERQALETIIEASDLSVRLDAIIGEHLPALERIITALGKRALDTTTMNRQLMLENRKIGKTYSDVVADVSITTPETGVYGISVHARPAVNDPLDAVEIFNVTLNKHGKTTHDPEIIEELEELIDLTLST